MIIFPPAFECRHLLFATGLQPRFDLAQALVGKLLKDMGYEKVFNRGWLKDWAESGGKVNK